MEKELFEAELNGNQVWFVREINNTLGMMFSTLSDASDFLVGGKRSPFGVAVNDEVLTMGTSVGWLKNIKKLK